MTDDGNGVGANTANVFSDAAGRIRDAAKWLLAAFALVGATFAAGIQLSSLGNLTFDTAEDRLDWAIAGVSLTVLGIAIAIGGATLVIGKSFVTMYWLKSKDYRHDQIDKDQVLLASRANVGALYKEYHEALSAQSVAANAYLAAPDKTKEVELNAASSKVTYLDKISQNVVEQASYRRLRFWWLWSRLGVFVGAVLAAAGIAVFAWAANPPQLTATPVVPNTPTEVILEIATDHRALLKPVLGANCDLSKPLAGLAMAVAGDVYTVAIVPTDTCLATVITVPPEAGKVTLRNPSGDDAAEQK